jgi:D-xylose 1-dehydrogenase (NADP+, D-xylono-1,5-lactone-forming)
VADPVRWGILSTARINRLVLPALHAAALSEVVAVASRSDETAKAYAAEHGIPRAHGSYEELLADPEVEAVYIPLPNGLHVEWTVRALEAGKHVLCEKPLDWRPAEVERAFDAADRASLLLMEAFMYRHHPQTTRVAELVAGGAIGELRAVRASFGFTLSDPANVRLIAELGGGALLDVGCYCVSLARLVAGEPLVATGQAVRGPSAVDLRFAGVLTFAGDVLAHFDCGFDVPDRDAAEIVGSDGTLVVASPFVIASQRLRIVRDRDRVEEVEVEPGDRYLLQAENFSAAVRGSAVPLLGKDDALGQVRALDALGRSAAQGGVPVELR